MSIKKISRREMLKGLGLAAASAALASCGPAPTPQVIKETVVVEKEVAEAKPEKLTFWHMYFDDDANKGLVIKDFANSFTSATGVPAELSQIHWKDHVVRMTTVAAAQDKVPDVFISGLAVGGLRGMVGGDICLPLDDYLTSEELDEYLPDLLNQCRVDGKLYALPQEMQALCFISNNEIFEDVGISEPTTIDELEVAFQKMLDAGIEAPMGVVGANASCVTWLFQALATLMATQKEMDAVSRGETKFSDKFLVAEELIADWNQRGFYGPNVLATEWGPSANLMYEKRIGVMVMGGFWPAKVKELYSLQDLNFGILAPKPVASGIPEQICAGLWWGVSVNSRSDFPEWDVRLARTMTGKGFSEQWIRRTFNLATAKVDVEKVTFSPLVETLNRLNTHKATWFYVPPAITSDYTEIQNRLMVNDLTAKEAATQIDALFASL